MSASTFQPIEARPAPVKTDGLVAWIRINLFADWKTTLGTLLIGAALLAILPRFLNWALFHAVWVPHFEACHAEGAGACWGGDCGRSSASSSLAASRLKSNGGHCWPPCCCAAC